MAADRKIISNLRTLMRRIDGGLSVNAAARLVRPKPCHPSTLSAAIKRASAPIGRSNAGMTRKIKLSSGVVEVRASQPIRIITGSRVMIADASVADVGDRVALIELPDDVGTVVE